MFPFVCFLTRNKNKSPSLYITCRSQRIARGGAVFETRQKIKAAERAIGMFSATKMIPTPVHPSSQSSPSRIKKKERVDTNNSSRIAFPWMRATDASLLHCFLPRDTVQVRYKILLLAPGKDSTCRGTNAATGVRHAPFHGHVGGGQELSPTINSAPEKSSP